MFTCKGASRLRRRTRAKLSQAPPDVIARARQLAEICARHNVPLAAASLQFSLRDPRIISTIVGLSQPERLAHTVALAQHPIPDALWAELATVMPTTGDLEAGRFS